MKAFVDRCVFCNHLPVKYWQHDQLTYLLECPACGKGLIYRELYDKKATWNQRQGSEVKKRFSTLGGRTDKFVLVDKKTGLFPDKTEITIEDFIACPVIEIYVDLKDGSSIHVEAYLDIWIKGYEIKLNYRLFSNDELDRIVLHDAYQLRVYGMRIYGKDKKPTINKLTGYHGHDFDWITFGLDLDYYEVERRLHTKL